MTVPIEAGKGGMMSRFYWGMLSLCIGLVAAIVADHSFMMGVLIGLPALIISLTLIFTSSPERP